MIRKWDIENEEAQRKCIDEILVRIFEQGESEFGIIAAQDILDIVASYIGPAAYNSGIEEAKKAVQTKLTDLEVDLDILRV